MASDRKPFTEKLVETGTRIVARAAEKVMNDPRGQDALAHAIGLAQRGRRRVEQMQERLMKAAGIPGRQDYDDLAKQLARIKRKARELAEQLDAQEAEDPDGEAAEGSSGNGRSRG